jgi:sigma-B regulation protein RsbU (phosphoserine phosphatase)
MQAIQTITPQTAAPRSWLGADWKAIQDLEDVRQVSARLFPQKLPRLASVAYAGVCVEANLAGGDFYDFWDNGPRRLGLAVADVSGNGVASALLRATLQASLRTLRLTGLTDFEGQLTLANRLLLESAPEAMYASLFLADYDERSRRLRYVNCGHPAPVLLRGERTSWLQPTATVLGLFSDWQCSVTEVHLRPGDTLLLYTDGVTEATDLAGDEFGPDRLVATLKMQNGLPLSMVLQECVGEVRRFAQSNPCDDLTLVGLRCLASK